MCICRVCLKQDRTVVCLDQNDVEDSQILRMLDDLVHPSLYSTRAKLPDEICKSCIENLKKAFELKNRYKKSIYEFAQEQQIENKAAAVSSTEKNKPNSSVENEIVYIADSDNEGDC